MCLFFTAVIFDDGEAADRQVHGPFDSESALDDAIEEFTDEHDDVVVCPVSALVSDGDVNLLIDDY